MKQFIAFVVVIFAGIAAADGYAAVSAKDIWKEDGSYVVPWKTMSAEKKAFVLEKYKSEIDYCRDNWGKSFKELDVEKIKAPEYEEQVGYVTYGLIAGKYNQYGDYEKAAEYYYKDHLQAVKCQRESYKNGDCWPGMPGPGEATAFDYLILTLERNNDYNALLPHYQQSFDAWVNSTDGSTYEEKYSRLKEIIKSDSEIASQYNDLMNRWEKARKLAKTMKPKPLDPAVQYHGWFYSNKQEEVLKSLVYYHKHNVRFMLEKALDHKDPVIVATAKKYLANPVKGKEKAVGNNEAKN